MKRGSICINYLEYFCKKGSSLFPYSLCIHLFIYKVMLFCFDYNLLLCCLYCCSNCSSFGIWVLSHVGSFISLAHSFLLSFEHFPTQVVHSLLHPRNPLLLQGALVPLLEEIKTQALSINNLIFK